MKKIFVYFLCVSFLLMMGQFHSMVAEAKDKVLPVGEMVSKGIVKYEAKGSVWRDVESSLFPVFPGMKIKTEKGNASIVFSDGSQIEISPNSLFSIMQAGQIQLSQGNLEFRILSDSELNFKVGNLSVLKSRTLQASRTTTPVAPIKGEVVGSISIHSNGSVTIKNVQGGLSVLDENRVLLAALSSKDFVTIPSTTVQTSPRTMTAQVGQTTSAAGGTTTTTGGTFLGLSTWAWVGISIATIVLTGFVVYEATKDDDHNDFVPICP